MLSLRMRPAPSLAIAATLLPAFLFSVKSASAQVQTTTPASNLPATQLKVTSNLVVVRVVVRDAQGKAVKGLRKEDFKLFDAGKEQPIAQFEAESAVELPSSPAAAHGPQPAGAAPSPAFPGRFLALYFDDLYTPDSDMIQVRQAAEDYLSANLQPGSYRIREVVTDSEQRLTALSRNVDIPEIIPTTPTASAMPPHSTQAPVPQPSGQPNPQLAQPSQTSSQATQPSLNQARMRAEETRLYSQARSYLDGPAPELEKKVRELKGLKWDSSQEQLSDLLLKIGARVDELVAKVPDLTSDERVTQTQWVVGQAQDCATHSRVPGSFPIENCSQTSGKRIQKDFHYMIVSRQTQDGRVLDEFRTNEQNQPLKSGAEGPSFQGFVGSWVIFSPSNRSESRFHYLGEQKIGKREAFVIAFAQIPGSVNAPVMLVSGGRFVPILFQGVAWVDEDDFRIIQLRTDILAPQQDSGLQRETAKILFGPVDISRLNLELWLPMGVDVNVEANGLAVQEQHVYSKYRLYHATSEILP